MATLDPDNEIIIVAFAIVPKESEQWWSWFLRQWVLMRGDYEGDEDEDEITATGWTALSLVIEVKASSMPSTATCQMHTTTTAANTSLQTSRKITAAGWRSSSSRAAYAPAARLRPFTRRD